MQLSLHVTRKFFPQSTSRWKIWNALPIVTMRKIPLWDVDKIRKTVRDLSTESKKSCLDYLKNLNKLSDAYMKMKA